MKTIANVTLLICGLMMASSNTVMGGAPCCPAPQKNAAEAFPELLNVLPGKWSAKNEDGTDAGEITYALIAGGSALAETYESMVSIYTIHETGLVMTHYCSAGNQPRLVASKYDDVGRAVSFTFKDITGLDAGETHISGLKLEILSNTQVKQTWTHVTKEGKSESFSFLLTKVGK